MQSFWKNLFISAYDDADPPPADPPPADPPPADPVVKDQNQLNAVLKREKEKFRAEREKMAKQLEELQTSSRMTAEERETLANQIEELRTAHLTEAEQLKRAKEKAENDYKKQLETEATRAKQWETKFASQKIGYDIKTAGDRHEVIPQQMKFLEAYLAPNARLVEIVGEDGKGTGDYTAKVKFQDRDKEGKAINVELPIEDAVKRMKELPDEFGYLFKGPNGGLGAASGNPGKSKTVGQLTTAEYLKARKENPSLLYGKK